MKCLRTMVYLVFLIDGEIRMPKEGPFTRGTRQPWGISRSDRGGPQTEAGSIVYAHTASIKIAVAKANRCASALQKIALGTSFLQLDFLRCLTGPSVPAVTSRRDADQNYPPRIHPWS